MKTTLFFILFSFSSLAVASDIEKQLEKKSVNYTLLRKYYSTLLAHVNTQDDKLFCSHVQNSVPLLNLVFEDDQQLIRALRTSQDIDFREYATLIEENSMTPLFSSHAYTDLCDNNQREKILSLVQSLQYHVMNVDYLSMSNLLFWQSISTQ